MKRDELMWNAVRGRDLTLHEVAEHFGDEDHWGTMVVGEGDAKRCVWVWVGPNVPPFELAQRAIRAGEGAGGAWRRHVQPDPDDGKPVKVPTWEEWQSAGVTIARLRDALDDQHDAAAETADLRAKLARVRGILRDDVALKLQRIRAALEGGSDGE